jgi:aromatic ring hydroxylase
VDRETDAGLIVSGAKMLTTGSALTHYNFIARANTGPIKTKEFAVTFIAAMGTPGVKLICRVSYAMTAEVMGSPFDYPLSSRLDENDAIIVFAQTLIPWENVFVYENVDKGTTLITGVLYSAHRRPVLDAISGETYTLIHCEQERLASITLPWWQGERHGYRKMGNPGATATSDRSATPSMRDITDDV